MTPTSPSPRRKRALGDFQTPPELVTLMLDHLGPIGPRWPRVLEPTCGRGNVIAGLLNSPEPPREIVGVELEAGHLERARARLGSASEVRLLAGDVFRLDLGRDLAWRGSGGLLVIGNPPWVTNAELSILGSENRPERSNRDRRAGLEAMTGASNFDLAEAVWLKLLDELAEQRPTIALLCKMQVARRVLLACDRRGHSIASASIVQIDGRRWFDAATTACLLRLDVGERAGPIEVPAYPGFGARQPTARLGIVGGGWVGDLDGYRAVAHLDGEWAGQWRQGVKHDAAAVMELLVAEDARLRNGLGEVVDVEDAYVFPLLKGGDLARGPSESPTRRVVLTQRSLGDDPTRLADEAPRLWAYLTGHEERFDRRRSSVYRRRPRFAMFGIGPYTFAPYKVAVSGLHRTPSFRAVGPHEGRPVAFDDTCYFAPFESAPEAAVVEALLNDQPCRAFLAATAVPGAKRTVTKRLLQRIDLSELMAHTAPERAIGRARPILQWLVPDHPEVDGALTEALQSLTTYSRSARRAMRPGKMANSPSSSSMRRS